MSASWMSFRDSGGACRHTPPQLRVALVPLLLVKHALVVVDA